jgi:hypothetical protein
MTISKPKKGHLKMEKILNPKTQKAQMLVNQYEQATMYELWELYGRFSRAKAYAFDRCKETMRQMNGYGMRIIGGNSCTFSCGCIAFHKGQKGVLYFTAYNTYFVPLIEGVNQ